MAAEQFCLRWNNFQSNIASALGSLKAEQDLVDVTLTCGGRSVKAHKVILSACSPYFHSVFKENPCQHPVVILKDVRYDDVLALLSFMYQGEVFITQDQLSTFLETAELLQVRGLTGAVNPVKESPQQKSSSMPSLAPPPLSSLLQKNFLKSATITPTHSPSSSLRGASLAHHQSKQTPSVAKRSMPPASRSISPASETVASKEQLSAPPSPQPPVKRRKAIPRRVSTSSLASSDAGNDAPNSNSSIVDHSRVSDDSLALLDHVSVNLSEVKQEPMDRNSDSVTLDNDLNDDGEVFNDHDDHENDQDDSRGGFYMDDMDGEAGTSSLLARSLAGVSPRSSDSHGGIATNNQTTATDLTAGGDGPKGGSLHCGTCPHCGQNYSNLSALKYHVRLMHSDLTNRLCCHLCPRSFVQREQYRQHMWDKHGTRN